MELRPFPFHIVELLAERIGHHQNTGKQYRGVHTVAPKRLKRHFDRQFRREAQIQKAARLSPGRPDSADTGQPDASARTGGVPVPPLSARMNSFCELSNV